MAKTRLETHTDVEQLIIGARQLATHCVPSISQLSFSSGDKLLVLSKSSSDWWWAELQGVKGYVPANYLRPDGAEEDPWQDEEYFGTYGTLVRKKGRFACLSLLNCITQVTTSLNKVCLHLFNYLNHIDFL